MKVVNHGRTILFGSRVLQAGTEVEEFPGWEALGFVEVAPVDAQPEVVNSGSGGVEAEGGVGRPLPEAETAPGEAPASAPKAKKGKGK